MLPDHLADQTNQLRFGLDFCDYWKANQLPTGIWNELNFWQCSGICMVTRNNRVRLLAFERMRQIGTFDNWRNQLFAPLRNHPKLILTALSMMNKLSAKNKKPNQILRVVKDAFAIAGMLKPVRDIGQHAKQHLPDQLPDQLSARN